MFDLFAIFEKKKFKPVLRACTRELYSTSHQTFMSELLKIENIVSID